MIRILIVDDHHLVRKALIGLLGRVEGFQIVAEASDGEGAVRLARQMNPDVILMDIKMPGIGGLEATRRILLYNPNMKVLGLSSCKDDPFPSRFVQSGAAGYVTKTVPFEELERAIRDVYAGRRYLTPEIAQQIALHHLIEESSPLDVLSERELQVMIMITSGQKVQEISQRLCLSPKTVNSYRYRLFEKLAINSDVELTHMAIKHGMIDVKLPTEHSEN